MGGHVRTWKQRWSVVVWCIGAVRGTSSCVCVYGASSRRALVPRAVFALVKVPRGIATCRFPRVRGKVSDGSWMGGNAP